MFVEFIWKICQGVALTYNSGERFSWGRSLGLLLWEGVFALSCNKYLLSAYCTRCCGGDGDESGSPSALGCVDSDSLNYGCTGSSKWLLIGVMRNALWSGFLVLEALFGSVITLIKESWSCFLFFHHISFLVFPFCFVTESVWSVYQLLDFNAE